MDQEWLDYVLQNESGSQLSFFVEDKLIAVVGLCHPSPELEAYVLTDIAIKPKLRREGFGRAVIDALFSSNSFTLSPLWIAYVSSENFDAQRFFAKIGWQCIAEPKDSDDMYTFKYSIPNTADK